MKSFVPFHTQRNGKMPPPYKRPICAWEYLICQWRKQKRTHNVGHHHQPANQRTSGIYSRYRATWANISWYYFFSPLLQYANGFLDLDCIWVGASHVHVYIHLLPYSVQLLCFCSQADELLIRWRLNMMC